jgi:hypothetical protein
MMPAVACFLSVLACNIASVQAEGPPVSYSRDVKPILSNHCYACHGPDEGRRKAKLRLDVRANAVRKAIKPGHAAKSPLVERVTSDDPEEVMPPPRSKRPPLTAVQVATLKRWIDQGAKFDVHWAYVKPARPAVPAVSNGPWTRNAIDHFIAAAHEKRGFQPAPEADRVTLIRRLSFDLTGLPPSRRDVEAFLADTSPDAYEKLVERMLTSKHFGERMAMYWLDLVRFADTNGYHSDVHRNLALYRDWVIGAFNDNKRFDQFTALQLAGDLLPGATAEQKIASGYNRLLMTTEEGGGQAKEYLAKYAADRVRNVSAVWLGATMGCCECHNHKFDPYTMKDFYSLASFFADVRETPVGRQEEMPFPSADQEQQLRKIDQELAAARARLQEKEKGLKARSKPAKGEDAEMKKALQPLRQEVARLEGEKKKLQASMPTTLVSASMQPRTMRILPRGNWLDDSGDIVSPAVPAFLTPLGVEKRRANRLDLAKWFVSRDNPLVARVFVNRLWKLLFGQGIVRSLDDFGTQGAVPTHPELLDWLAMEFMDSGWDVKHMIRLMAVSSTYRQASSAGKELRERDPGNEWLARQGRFRLDAEMVRDNALAISGQLSLQIGGPSVKPYQPAGYWQYLNFPRRTYQHDHGHNQYRRGLYTYWQRTFLHPSLKAFDAPTREECCVERPRSSTPLQALVLLNDPTYVEAARVFAERILREGGKDVPARLDWAYRQALSRGVRPAEARVLAELLQKHQADYAKDEAAAGKLVGIGEWPLPSGVSVGELAAWTSVARVILNLHETITRN